jgi:hypothetical protein
MQFDQDDLHSSVGLQRRGLLMLAAAWQNLTGGAECGASFDGKELIRAEYPM